MAQTRDALKILENVTGNNEAVKTGIAQAGINFEIAQMIYDARTRAGLSQSELAALIGSKQPVIARLEDADYAGHSLTMLQRIAAALEQHLELRFVPQGNRAKRWPPSSVPSRRRKLLQA
jgi:ribosome-binding protein aMBF1 (putative translation factor)